MTRLLMNLRGVPEDEAAEVRELLDEQAVDYYETPPNRWGISMGGIWLRDDDQYEQVRRLLDAYQARRQQRARAEQAERERNGTAETFTSLLRRNPARWALYGIVILGLLYISIRPFFGW
jgi:regulator of protease activity HflC (stomatin/prohibitin superfamily)